MHMNIYRILPILSCLLLNGWQTTAQSARQLPEQQVRSYLSKHSTDYGLSAADLQQAVLVDQYSTRHNGVTHLYFQQQWLDLPIEGAYLNANVWQGQVLGVNHCLVDQLAAKAPATITPGLTAEAAVREAARQLGYRDWTALTPEQLSPGAAQAQTFLAPQLSLDPIPASLAWVPAEDGKSLRLAWNLTIHALDHQHWWNVWVDATSGDLLVQHDWVSNCNFHEHETELSIGQLEALAQDVRDPLQLYAAPMPMAVPQYRVFPISVESPNHGGRSLEVDPSDLLASPFGWHDVDGVAGEEFTTTRGNNVWAMEDRNGDNGVGASPNGGASLSFDFPIPANSAPLAYVDASTTNLFYWNNLMHDLWYHYGFDEPSGNFQANNYNRGGQQNDFVFADAQDGSGTNNANFATPPDGLSGRMQMFLWGGSGPVNYLSLNSPAPLAGSYQTSTAIFGPAIPATPITSDLVLVQDSVGTSDACTPIVNAATISGKIAVLDRGNCSFVEKVQRAQDSGAVAVIVVNDQNVPLFNMGGTSSTINIPSVMISLADGNAIKAALLNGPVNATIVDPGNVNAIDASFDNGIIAHEYGHGISNRLTGGPGSFCLGNEEQAGEGWSDWFSLVMTVEPGDQATDARGIGTFAIEEPTDGIGIRPYPYSTNLSLSPYTYDDIKTFSVPHGVGAVMCAMLWDLYWAMVEEHGYDPDWYQGTGGNNMAMQLVIDGMKLQPCGPGFVDVRDAILLADQINYGGANECLIWRVFARRGLGFSADQGSSNDRSDGTEAFDVPPACREILYLEKRAESEAVEVGESMTYEFFINNLKPTTATAIVIRDTLPQPLRYVANSGSCPTVVNNGIVTIVLDSLASKQSRTCSIEVEIPAAATPSVFSVEENIEDLGANWLTASQMGSDTWRIDSLNPFSGQYAWFVPNEGALNDQILSLLVQPLTTPSTLSFWHHYDTETDWDGGVVELRTQSGADWIDLGPFMLENGYNGSLGPNSPLGAVDAFTGSSGRYVQTTIDLSSFVGQLFFVRFRFLSDDNTSETGWWLDELRIGQEVKFSNQACLTSAQGDSYCAQQPRVTLVLEASGDPNTSLRPALEAVAFTVAPNPAKDLVQVAWQPANTTTQVTLRNLMGQALWQEQVVPGRSDLQIPLDRFAAGMYVVELQQDGQIGRARLMVQH